MVGIVVHLSTKFTKKLALPQYYWEIKRVTSPIQASSTCLFYHEYPRYLFNKGKCFGALAPPLLSYLGFTLWDYRGCLFD